MFRLLIWVVGTYVLLVVQTAICPAIAVGPIVPQLLTALLIPCLGNSTRRTALWGAAVWGLAADSLGSAPLGINLISFTLVAVVVQRALEQRRTERTLGKIVWMVPAIISLLAVEMLATWPFEKLAGNWTGAVVLLAGTALYSFLLGLGWLAVAESARHIAGRVRQDTQRPGFSKSPVLGW